MYCVIKGEKLNQHQYHWEASLLRLTSVSLLSPSLMRSSRYNVCDTLHLFYRWGRIGCALNFVLLHRVSTMAWFALQKLPKDFSLLS